MNTSSRSGSRSEMDSRYTPLAAGHFDDAGQGRVRVLHAQVELAVDGRHLLYQSRFFELTRKQIIIPGLDHDHLALQLLLECMWGESSATILLLVDDGDAVAQLICLVHVVCRQDDSDVLPLLQVPDVAPDVVTALGVQADGGSSRKSTFG